MMRPHRNEAGFSLVELLVVMVIMGVVGTVVGTSLVQGMRTSATAQSRIHALSDLQRGAERVSRELRVADPLCLTPGQEEQRLGASVYRDGKRYRYDFYLQGSGDTQELVQDVTLFDPPESTTGTLVSSGTFIAEVGNDLILDVSGDPLPLFEYLDQSGEPPVTYQAAAQVQLNLTKQVADDDPIRVTTTVEVRNTRYAGGGDLC